MTKPTVKGGLAPANAVEVKGRGCGMRDASGSAWPVTTFDPDDSKRFPMNPNKGTSGLL
ncbi:hypothetical protein [Pseudomonas sp. NPDC090592]|uniref:hypothetical protein n=1 Tax=Pseudomonas sp. NPDC090592 TaxID=3364480 RepID=UPI00383A3CE5